jgi:hypothetical protein
VPGDARVRFPLPAENPRAGLPPRARLFQFQMAGCPEFRLSSLTPIAAADSPGSTSLPIARSDLLTIGSTLVGAVTGALPTPRVACLITVSLRLISSLFCSQCTASARISSTSLRMRSPRIVSPGFVGFRHFVISARSSGEMLSRISLMPP